MDVPWRKCLERRSPPDGRETKLRGLERICEGGCQPFADGGVVISTLTRIYPWGRYALSERVEVWGAAGYGVSTPTLEPGGQDAIRTSRGPLMAAAGLRGVVIEDGTEDFTLEAKSDSMTVETSTNAVRGIEDAEAGVTQFLLCLQGTPLILFDDRSLLTPSIATGLRCDGAGIDGGPA